VLRNELLDPWRFTIWFHRFWSGRNHFSSAAVTVDIWSWETSPILLFDRSLWINRKEGMTRVSSVYDQCDPQAIMHYADAEAVDDWLNWWNCISWVYNWRDFNAANIMMNRLDGSYSRGLLMPSFWKWYPYAERWFPSGG
jgi:hypothetical protein